MTNVPTGLRDALSERYPIERLLGRGGMATVYLARDVKHHRPVALKVLHPELAAGLGAERFLREIRIEAGLQHPNILPLHDSGEAAGFLYYVMPYVSGESLREEIARHGRLPVPEALRIAGEVADALSHAHERGVVHRDIKPENILLSGGHALVADFGIAKAVEAAGDARLTETGWGMGTPAYMSPEQILGEAVDGRSDVYALGCVLFEMLGGHPPFAGANARAVFTRHQTEPAPSIRAVRPEVASHIDHAVRTGLAKKPDDRFATAAQLMEALRTPTWSQRRLASEEAAGPRDGVPVPPAALAMALQGRYTLGRELGRGGMAVVWLAHDLKHNRPVALKILRPELSYALGPERFQREIELAARLTHPHILPLFDSGTADGLLYYAMPYIEGESLRQRLVRERQLPLNDAIRIALEVADALGHAHSHGVVHRDIKPENILLGEGRALVADFGIARALDVASGQKLTETGLALGTPHYMSPEQAVGDSHVDGRSDIYSLGCVLYEMLAGEPPFGGSTGQAILARHSVDPVPSLRTVRRTLPEAVEQAVVTALAKVPADRFATAAEFSQALTSPSSAARGTRRVTPRIIRWAVPASAAVLLAGAAGAWLALHPRGPRIVPSASRIAVLPLTPTVADTALTRLGRDLVFTVSANLDEVGEVRIVDAHTILAQSATAGISLPSAAALGRRFGAGSVVHGSIARLSPQLVRLDFGLFTSDSLTPIARASVSASPDSVAVLSDSITRALLQHIWRRGEPPTPSLDAALKTRSAPALRAFLEGERALVENRWSDAAESYARAISADSTFWLPYWRYAFSRGYWEGQEIDSVIVKAFETHRSELPPADRLSIESSMALRDSFSVAVARAKEVTQRFPDYWFGWLVYGDYLVHRAPILGFRVAEAGPALERALQLNPRLTPAWEHLTWVYCKSRDPTGATRGLEAALGRLDPSLRRAEGLDQLLQFRLLARLAETGGQPDRALIDSVARTSARGGGAELGLLGWCGFRRAQVEISRQVLRLGPAPDVAARHRRFLAQGWLARGAWDSVSVALDEHAKQEPGDWWTALDQYALAVAGVWLGGLDASEAAKRRGAAARMVEQTPVDEGQPDFQAMIVWLDGMLAWAQGDVAGLESARRELEKVDRVYTSWKNAPWERSLAAFQLALTGATRKAGFALAALEWEGAEKLSDGSFRQYLTALDRLAASRWLLEAGDTAQAARLLTWNEAWGGTSGTVGSMFASHAYLERARIEDSRGNIPLAQEYYQDFLFQYDMPTPKQRHLVDEARAALARLSGERASSAERAQ